MVQQLLILHSHGVHRHIQGRNVWQWIQIPKQSALSSTTLEREPKNEHILESSSGFYLKEIANAHAQNRDPQIQILVCASRMVLGLIPKGSSRFWISKIKNCDF